MPIVIDPPESPALKPAPEDGTELWEIFYAAMGFHRDTDEENDFALRKFCEAWCAPLQPVYDLVRERDDAAPWGIAFDVENAPASVLPWLAQFVGVVPQPGWDEEQLRNEIREPTGWKRGQEPSIKIAVQRTLTGTKKVFLRPRKPTVGHTYIRVLKAECPDEARTAAVARACVPAWEALDVEALDGVTWTDIEAAYEDWNEIESTFADFNDLEDILPDELPE